MGEVLWQCLKVVLVVLGRQAAVIRLSVAHPCKENHTLCPVVGWQVVVTNQLVVHQKEENLTLFLMVGFGFSGVKHKSTNLTSLQGNYFHPHIKRDYNSHRFSFFTFSKIDFKTSPFWLTFIHSNVCLNQD